MTVNLYDGSAGLFDVLGKVFYAAQVAQTSAGTTLPAELLDILTQFENVGDDLELSETTASVITATDAYKAGAESALSVLRTFCQDYLVEVVHDDVSLQTKTFQAALAELIEQMENNSESVDASTVTATAAAVGSPDGNGLVVVTEKRGDGLVNEHSYAEVITVEAVTDRPSSLTVSTGESTELLSVDWPIKSGASGSLNITNVGTGLITDGGFDTVATEDTNLPKGWIQTVGTPGVDIDLTSPEVQTITISGTPTGGYYLLQWTDSDGETHSTATIDYNATGSAVQSALRKIPGLEKVTVATTGTSPNYTHTVTFIGSGGNVGLLASINRMTGATGTNEVQTLTLTNAEGGTFTLTWDFGGGDETTAAIAYNATTATIQAAIEALTTPVSGDVVVGGGPLPGSSVTITFTGALATTDINAGYVDAGSLTGSTPAITVTETTKGATGTNEVQTVGFDAEPTGGTFTLSFGGQTTSAIAYNASATTIDTALEALSSIGSGNVLCGGGPINTTDVTVTFQGDLAGTAVAAITGDTSALTGATVAMSVDVLTAGDPGTDEVQTLTLEGTPTGGTFTLTFDGQTTGAIAYNASAATVDTALEALSNIGAGDVAVTGGPLPGSTLTITFGGALAATNVAMLTCDPSSLTGGSNIVSVAETTAGSPDLATGLQALWKMNETDGTRFDSVGSLDLTKHFSSGTVPSATGVIGNAVSFSGASTYLETTDVTGKLGRIGADATGELTIACWVYLYSDFGTIMKRGYGTATEYNLYVNGGEVAIHIFTDTNAYFASTSIPSNEWAFVVATISETDGEIGISVNGAAKATRSFTGTLTTGSSYPRVGFDGAFLNGKIDHLAIWQRNLGAAEISACYNGGSGVTTPLSSGTNEVQTITVAGSPTTGTFDLTYGGQTATIPYDASASIVETLLEGLTSIGSGNVTCTGGPLPGTAVTVTFQGDLASTDVALLTADGSNLQASVTVITEGAASADEQQRISATPDPTAGTYTLTFGANTTGSLAYDATASTVQSALEGLASIGTGNIAVSGGPLSTGPFIATFQGSLAATDVASMSATPTMTGVAPGLDVTETTPGVDGTNEVQTVTLTGTEGGTFTLTHSASTTSAIAWDATATDVEAALDALGIADFSVTGSAGGPFAVTFDGALKKADVAAFTYSTASLTGSTASGSIAETTQGSTTSGAITHATTLAGTTQVYSGTYAVTMPGDGSTLTEMVYELSGLNAETCYALNAFLTVAATAASGVLTFALVDGSGGSVINDQQGNANMLTVNASALTTSWQALADVLASGVPVFRTPRKMPSSVYLRVKWSTALQSGKTAYLDHLSLVKMTELYSGGPFAAAFAGNAEFRIGDAWTVTVTNDRAGTIHEWANRMFDLAASGLLLPSDSGGLETIPDSVIS